MYEKLFLPLFPILISYNKLYIYSYNVYGFFYLNSNMRKAEDKYGGHATDPPPLTVSP